MSAPLDVVIVPDFTEQQRGRFEARTLFFLAAWLEYGGRARSFPLHLACIGDPPPSVAWLAARAGARVRVFTPLAIDQRGSSNKMRGLEIDAVTDRILLLDADVLVLSDFSDLGAMAPALSAAAAITPRLPEDHWRRIYTGLGLDLPDERMTSSAGRVYGDLTHRPRFSGQDQAVHRMLPYYNSGVLVVPRTAGLRPVWEDHVRRISTMFDPSDVAYRSIVGSDQAGLATAIVTLRRQGVPFTELPDRFHATRLQMYRRTLALDDMALFHAFWLFGPTRRADWTLPLQVERYRLSAIHKLVEAWRQDPFPGSRLAHVRQYLWPACRDANALRGRLMALYRTYVRPALAAARVSSA